MKIWPHWTLIWALAALACLVSRGVALSVYPPITYLASELGVIKGQQLPKGVIYNGRPFFFYIVSAQEHANGRYTVELEAR